MIPFEPSADQEAELTRLAHEKGTGTEVLVAEAVHAYIEREHKLAELRRDIQLGDEQFERGEYTEYDDETLKAFFEDIKRSGRERLKAKQQHASQ